MVLLPVALPGADVESKSLKEIYQTGTIEFIPQMEITVDTFMEDAACKAPVAFTLRDNDLYILDGGANNFKIADRSGKFKKVVGFKGRGPGALYIPLSIAFAGDVLAIWDAGNDRFALFTPKGKIIRTLGNIGKKSVSRMKSLDNGRLVIQWERDFWREGNQRWKYVELVLHSPNLNKIKSLFKGTVYRYKYIEKLGKSFPCNFTSRVYWDVLSGNKIVYGKSDKYVITIHDTETDKKNTFTHHYTPKKITAEEKEFVFQNLSVDLRTKKATKLEREYYPFPEYLPAFEHIVVDVDGNILVMCHRESHYLNREFDAFDAEGNFINRVKITSPPEGVQFHDVIPEKGNIFWVMGSNDDLYSSLTKFKVK